MYIGSLGIVGRYHRLQARMSPHIYVDSMIVCHSVRTVYPLVVF